MFYGPQVKVKYDAQEDRVFFLYKLGDQVAAPLTMEQYEPGAMRQATFSLSVEEAQNLLESLMAAGIKSKLPAPVANVEDLRNHLADMRKLVFESLVPLIPKVVE